MKKFCFLMVFLHQMICYGQSELFVVFSKAKQKVCYTLGDYQSSFTISHKTGVYQIGDDSINLFVDFEESYNDDPGNNCNGPCGVIKDYCKNIELDLDLKPFSKVVRMSKDNLCESEVCDPFNMYALMLPNLVRGSANICERTVLFSNKDEVRRYQELEWYYFDESTVSWRIIPKYSDEYPLKRNLSDIFGIQARKFEGKSLKLRMQLQVGKPLTVLKSKYIHIFSVTQCSPTLDSSLIPNPSPVNATCATKNNGSFKVKYNRDLEINEKMHLYLSRKNGTSNIWEKTNHQKVLFKDDLTNKTYTWPKEIAAGTYKLHWIAINRKDDPDSANPKSYEESKPFTITSPPPLELKLKNSRGITCSGGKDGQIILEGKGGSGNLEYSIDGVHWQNSPHFSNLVSEEYHPQLRDKKENSCTKNLAPLRLEVKNTPMVLIAIPRAPKGATTKDGVISVSVKNGKQPYTYLWTQNNTTLGTNSSLSNLDAGTYTLVVTDNLGCTQKETFTLVAPPALEAKIQILDNEPENAVLCHQGKGKLEALAQGGTPPYSYQWRKEGETEVLSTQRLFFAQAGQYELRVRDSYNIEGIEKTIRYTLEEPLALEVKVQTVDNNCKGGADGKIQLQIEGGVAPYQVVWKHNAEGTSLDNLTEGMYFYTVTDANGCTVNNLDTGIEIKSPKQGTTIDVEEKQSNIIAGGATGSIKIRVQTLAGVQVEKISWFKNNQAFSAVFGEDAYEIKELEKGAYQVVVVDSEGCTTSSEAIEITEPLPLIIKDISLEMVNCFDDHTATATAIPQGGIPPYHYTWKNEQGVALTPISKKIENLKAGRYALILRDASGSTAMAQQEFSITQPEKPLALTTSNTLDNHCFGEENGSIEVEVTGGTPPYQYHWSNGETTQKISNLKAGSYTLEVVDAKSCIYTKSFTISQPDPLSLDKKLTYISGFGKADGSIHIEPKGGNAPYTFLWTSPTGLQKTTKNLDQLDVGIYTVQITDSKDCTYKESFEIFQPDPLAIEMQITKKLLCFADSNGSIEAKVSGGVKPYIFIWEKKQGEVYTTISSKSEVASQLTAGSYRLYIEDSNANTLYSNEMLLEEPQLLSIEEVQITNVNCDGGNNGAISLSATGGTPPYTYTWNTGATSANLEDLAVGKYTLELEDAQGCVLEKEIEISYAYESLGLQKKEIIDLSAFESGDGSITVVANGGLPPYAYRWKKEEQHAIIGNTSQIDLLDAGTYIVEIEDSLGCSYIEKILVNQPDLVLATTIPTTCSESCDGAISLEVNKGKEAFTYTWDHGESGAKLQGLCAGEYTVTITGYDNREIRRSYIIEAPEPLQLELGPNRTICLEQEVVLTATLEDMHSIVWKKDQEVWSQEKSIRVSQAGWYYAEATNAKGCIAKDSIYVKAANKKIAASFVASTQVYVGETIILVDISDPKPDAVHWELAEEAKVAHKDANYAEISFDAPGEYTVGMQTTLGECIAYSQKKILVIEKDMGQEEEDTNEEEQKTIESFIVYPNPSDGNFQVKVELDKKQEVRLKLFYMHNNQLIDFKKGKDKQDYNFDYQLMGLSKGLYFLLLETTTGKQLRKIIIK